MVEPDWEVMQMRGVRGYVCVSRIEGNRVLHGPAVRLGGQTFESIETNGIVLFPTLAAATTAAAELQRRFGTEVSVYFLRLQVAETEADLVKLHRRRGLVVLFHAEHGTHFWGRSLPERTTTLYGLPLVENGLRAFADFAAAERCAREVRRQGLSRASIAVFRIGLPLTAR